MRDFVGYMLIGVLAVLATGLATAAGLGLAVGARPVPERGAIIQDVDRTHKGDRLDLHATVGSRPVSKDKVVVPECEPIFSPLASPEEPRISGRCVA